MYVLSTKSSSKRSSVLEDDPQNICSNFHLRHYLQVIFRVTSPKSSF